MVWGTHIFAPPHMSFFGIRETAPGEGHGEGEIEVTGKDEYGVYEAGSGYDAFHLLALLSVG